MAVIAGNWKMHMGPAAACSFFARFDPSGVAERNELVVFPPTAALGAVASCPERDARVQLGCQNIHWEQAGAFTGETAAEMAAEAGASFALVGHSERRHVFGETDAEVVLKIRAARRAGLVPVVCVGETLDERRSDRVSEVILGQLGAALEALGTGEERFIIAYEPVWAIGTGETATPDDASQAHGTLRGELEARLGIAPAARLPILYGGSVKPDNAADLLAAPDVDGVLVGGASLDPVSFRAIAAAAAR